MKKYEDASVEVNRLREGSRQNLCHYIARKRELVEERDGIAKAASNARWRSAVRIRQLEGELRWERMTIIDLNWMVGNQWRVLAELQCNFASVSSDRTLVSSTLSHPRTRSVLR